MHSNVLHEQTTQMFINVNKCF